MIVAESPFVTCYGSRDADWNREVLAACPALSTGCSPPRWARNPHIQNALTVVRDRTAPPLAWDLEERLTMADGGTVSIQWAGLDEPAATPILVLMHTICGSGDALRRFVAAMRQDLGWVVAACNRRGHGDLVLTAPQINTMGSAPDLRAQLEAIEARRPGAALYGVGISAGSGLLVRYLGEEGSASKFHAAVAVCPAYDVPAAFRFVEPPYDAYMTRRLIDHFLVAHREVLGGVPGFDACAASTSLVEFHQRLFPLAGYPSERAYLEASNPMVVASQVRTPTLVINAADDPVCVEANVHRHLDELADLPRVLLALTRHGGHCGFFEGPGARHSWSHKAIVQYLVTAHSLTDKAASSRIEPPSRSVSRPLVHPYEELRV